jgi:predicted helicase
LFFKCYLDVEIYEEIFNPSAIVTPGIDCILLADLKRSTVDIVQALGRAGRRSEDKEFGYVIVSLLIDSDTGDVFDAQFKAFAPMLTVLRSLVSYDDRILNTPDQCLRGDRVEAPVKQKDNNLRLLPSPVP